jgi:hypothetical protein
LVAYLIKIQIKGDTAGYARRAKAPNRQAKRVFVGFKR